MAERARFKAYLILSVAMTAFVYPLVVHGTWGGGFIADISIGGARFSDFAGSMVVHGTGGFAALAGAVFLGPRLGKYTPDGRPRQIAGHAMPMVVLGVFILWLGWFGFNAGSQLAATAGSPMTRVILVLRRLGMLRVSAQEEALGLDLTEHGIGAYPADVLPRDARAYEPPK